MSINLNKNNAIQEIKGQLDSLMFFPQLKYSDEGFKLWLKHTQDIIEDLFGRDSRQFRSFSVIRYRPSIMVSGDPNNESKMQNAFKDGIKKASDSLNDMLRHIDKYWRDDGTTNGNEIEEKIDASNIFSETIIWKKIEREFDYSKNKFGRKINFISDAFKRKIIFRDIAQSYYLAQIGCYKPSVILAGAVIEELLKEFLKKNKVKPKNDNFNEYINCCERNSLLKIGISKLSHSVREFRNLVHLSKEQSKKFTISKTTAIGAVASIFTISNDF
jgi:hypothetical protein